jgi:hypothetical protein
MITLWKNVKEIKCSEGSSYTVTQASATTTNQTDYSSTIAPISNQIYSNCLSNGTQVLKYLSMDEVIKLFCIELVLLKFKFNIFFRKIFH